MPRATNPPIAPDNAPGGTVLLIIDMISCWDFPDADKLQPQAKRITPHIAALKARCVKAGVPVVYANDNRGRWRSDFPALVALSLACGNDGGWITQTLRPSEDDYFVLKPKHSAFFGTPMDMLLEYLHAHRVILTGVASDQCILCTAMECRMRDLDVVVPRDCVASQSQARNNAVLLQFDEALQLSTTSGPRLRLVNTPGKAPRSPSHPRTGASAKGPSGD